MKIKKYMINTLLAFIVLGIAFVPIILAKTQEWGFLNKLYMTEVEAKIKRDPPSIPVEDKLNLIVNYMKNNGNIVLIEKAENIFANKDMFSLALEEAKNMQGLGLFPKVDLEKEIKLKDYSLKTYIDKNNPENIATIWQGFFISDEYGFYISMDFKTYKIYEFSVYSDEEIPKIEDSLFQNRVSKYLDIMWDNSKEEEYYRGEIYTLKNREIIYMYSSEKNYTDFYLLTKNIVKK